MSALPCKHKLAINNDRNTCHKNGTKHHLSESIAIYCFFFIKNKPIEQEEETKNNRRTGAFVAKD
jgi:hypothetical protein